MIHDVISTHFHGFPHQFDQQFCFCSYFSVSFLKRSLWRTWNQYSVTMVIEIKIFNFISLMSYLMNEFLFIYSEILVLAFFIFSFENYSDSWQGTQRIPSKGISSQTRTCFERPRDQRKYSSEVSTIVFNIEGDSVQPYHFLNIATQ